MLQTQQHAIIWGYPFYIIITQSYKLIKVITLRAHLFLPPPPYKCHCDAGAKLFSKPDQQMRGRSHGSYPGRPSRQGVQLSV